jgi:hypothetical protein
VSQIHRPSTDHRWPLDSGLGTEPRPRGSIIRRAGGEGWKCLIIVAHQSDAQHGRSPSRINCNYRGCGDVSRDYRRGRDLELVVVSGPDLTNGVIIGGSTWFPCVAVALGRALTATMDISGYP